MFDIWLSFDPSDGFHERGLRQILSIVHGKIQNGDRDGMKTFIREAIVSAGLTQRFVEKVLREITVVEGTPLLPYLELSERFLLFCDEGRDLRLLKGFDVVVEKVWCGEYDVTTVQCCSDKVMSSMSVPDAYNIPNDVLSSCIDPAIPSIL